MLICPKVIAFWQRCMKLREKVQNEEWMLLVYFKKFLKLDCSLDIFVLDHEPNFRSAFWKRVMNHIGVKMRRSSRRHGRTDGASETMSRMVEKVLALVLVMLYRQLMWPSTIHRVCLLLIYLWRSRSWTVWAVYKLCSEAPLDFIWGPEISVQTVRELSPKLNCCWQDDQFSYKIVKAWHELETFDRYKFP